MSTNELKNATSFDKFAKELQEEIGSIEKDSSFKLKAEVPEHYEKDKHWEKMELCCELISKECTKMAVAFSKPPFPNQKDSMMLLQGVAKAVDMLLAWFKCFPINEGFLLNRSLENCILGILTSVASFTDCTLNDGKSPLTTSTGSVWENCKNFKMIPKDNITVAVNQINSSYLLISDAITEIEQSILEFDQEQLEDIEDDMEDPDEDEKWTEHEKSMMKPILGLLMASKGLLKKIKTSLKKLKINNNLDLNNKHNNEIDQLILEHVDQISPCIDDLVMMVYPPLNKEDIQNQINKLADLLKKTLLFLQNTTIGSNTENQVWIEFIQKAVDHNFNNTIQLINT